MSFSETAVFVDKEVMPMKKLGNCLFRVVMVLAVLWIVACLVANVYFYGKPLPGLG